MKKILLLGAGFSRNWGGWLASEAFEYLLGCPEVVSNKYLQQLLWRFQPTGGFEDALAQVRKNFILNPTANTNHLLDLQKAVTRMFVDMNKGYYDNREFEFQSSIQYMVGTFLTKFDAIFTLNQDLLIEHHYINRKTSTLSRRWSGTEIPGLGNFSNLTLSDPNSRDQGICYPVPPSEFKLNPRFQPYFKLHGSSNWKEIHGKPMLIMGGNKLQDIVFSPLLRWYYEEFEKHMCQADARLMVIGYGFRDTHINEVIIRAVNEYGLKMFIIAPEGSDLARKVNSNYQTAPPAIRKLEESFEHGLIGASRRSLGEIFGSDLIEFNKVMRFFQD